MCPQEHVSVPLWVCTHAVCFWEYLIPQTHFLRLLGNETNFPDSLTIRCGPMTEQWPALAHESLLCPILHALAPPSSDLANHLLKMEQPPHGRSRDSQGPLRQSHLLIGAPRLHLHEKLALRFEGICYRQKCCSNRDTAPATVSPNLWHSGDNPRKGTRQMKSRQCGGRTCGTTRCL